MPENLILDPEAEALLREMASDPRSALLRVARPQVIQGLFERYPRVGTQATGLTAAERHLLRVHRNEVAWLLREVCKFRLANGEKSRLSLSRSLTVNEDAIVLVEGEICSRARLCREDSIPVLEDAEVVALLEGCVAGSLHEGSTTSQIATASMRLEPSDSARMYAGLDFAFRGGQRAAIEVHERVLAGDPESLIASIAWDNIAMAYSLLGDHARGMRAYEESSRVRADRSLPLLGWLLESCQLGSEKDALEAAVRLAGLVPVGHGDLAEFLEAQILRRSRGEWVPTTSYRSLLSRVEHRMPVQARRIVDALV